MRFIVGLIALSCFAVSLIVHAQALGGVDVADHAPAVWLLHVGIFPVFGSFLYCARQDAGGKFSAATLIKELPGWALFLVAVVFVYMLVNFALSMDGARVGSAMIEHGQYVLKDHARFIRELSADEYTAIKANELRGFSGLWIFFILFRLRIFYFASRSSAPMTGSTNFLRKLKSARFRNPKQILAIATDNLSQQAGLRRRIKLHPLRTESPGEHDDQINTADLFASDRHSNRTELASLPERQGTTE